MSCWQKNKEICSTMKDGEHRNIGSGALKSEDNEKINLLAKK
jgi:hypothetical protein